jgi:16S rRNA (adenine1518-N6/adenine1519-N6)-dimethyltransferase
VSRRFGQHFLKPASVERLLRVIDPGADEDFLEIGAGAGALTIPLAGRCRSVKAVELDTRLVDRLRDRVPENVEVVSGDALSIDLESLFKRGGRLVGNLPYAISSPLMRRLLDLRARIRDMHVMLQEEVAERLAASPGSKAYGILSVLYGLWADLDIPLRFGPGCFSPPPAVRSALLRVRMLKTPRCEIHDFDHFEILITRSFARRRKTLENNLQDSYPNLKQHLRLLNIVGTRRAETLSVVEFVKLALALEGGGRIDG